MDSGSSNDLLTLDGETPTCKQDSLCHRPESNVDDTWFPVIYMFSWSCRYTEYFRWCNALLPIQGLPRWAPLQNWCIPWAPRPSDHQCQMQRSTAFQSKLKNVVSMRCSHCGGILLDRPVYPESSNPEMHSSWNERLLDPGDY